MPFIFDDPNYKMPAKEDRKENKKTVCIVEMFHELLAADINRQRPRQKSGIIGGFASIQGPMTCRESREKGKERKATA